MATLLQQSARELSAARFLWTRERYDRAIDAGLAVVVDKCIKMEHGRFGGALHFAGMNTEVITAQRRKLR